jgi:Autotransporter beta-domain
MWQLFLRTNGRHANVHLNGFGENGSLIPLVIHGDSEDSLVTDVGGRANYTWNGAKTTIIPQVELAWEHEYLYSNLPLTISAPALDGATTTIFGPNVGHDSMIIDASLSIHPTSLIWLTIGYNGQVLRDHYLSNSVIGTLSFSFWLGETAKDFLGERHRGFLEYNECDFPRHVERRPRLHWTTAQICRKFRPLLSGGMVERFIAPVLKTGDPQGSVGSNPTPSAMFVSVSSLMA